MSRIVTFGEVMLRLAPNGYYRFFQNDQMQAGFGGAEANVAVSLANFEEDVAFVTKVPDNPIGRGAISSLRGFGVDTSFIVKGGSRLGIYFLEKGASQRSSVCVYDRAHSAVQEASASDFDWEKIFKSAEWFHFTGITPALGSNVAAICKEACIQAKKEGLSVSCDLNYRSKLWTREEARAVMESFCPYIDLCICNEEDAKDVFGIEAAGSDVNSGKLDKEGYKNVAMQLCGKFGFKYAAITLRKSINANENFWSALLYDGNDFYFSKEYRLFVVDRVGGGDSFSAALIYSLLNKKTPLEAVEFAVAASALKHSVEGDFNRITLAEVEKLCKGDSSGRVRR